MSLKLAIWDVDGTIVDSRLVIQGAMEKAFKSQGIEPPIYDQTRQIVGLGLDEACRRLAPTDITSGQLTDLVNAYKTAFIDNRKDPDFKEPLYNGAFETLERLANDNWLMAVATGKSRRGLEVVLDMHDLGKFFDTLWCADDGPGKPHPFMVEQSMSALGVDPHQALMVGDAIFDIQMARSAGVEAHGVSWGFGETAELEDVGAHKVHHDFLSLNAAFDQFAGTLLEKSE